MRRPRGERRLLRSPATLTIGAPPACAGGCGTEPGTKASLAGTETGDRSLPRSVLSAYYLTPITSWSIFCYTSQLCEGSSAYGLLEGRAAPKRP